MIHTREQLILANLEANTQGKSANWKDLSSRAETLPTMILRHGYIPVRLFLQSKEEVTLLQWLDASVKAVLPHASWETLPSMPFETYMLTNEVAAEAAALMSRWIKVQIGASTSGTPHVPPSTHRAPSNSAAPGSAAKGRS